MANPCEVCPSKAQFDIVANGDCRVLSVCTFSCLEKWMRKARANRRMVDGCEMVDLSLGSRVKLQTVQHEEPTEPAKSTSGS